MCVVQIETFWLDVFLNFLVRWILLMCVVQIETFWLDVRCPQTSYSTGITSSNKFIGDKEDIAFAFS